MLHMLLNLNYFLWRWIHLLAAVGWVFRGAVFVL